MAQEHGPSVCGFELLRRSLDMLHSRVDLTISDSSEPALPRSAVRHSVVCPKLCLARLTAASSRGLLVTACMHAGVLPARSHLHIQHQAQVAHPAGVQHVAGPRGLGWVVQPSSAPCWRPSRGLMLASMSSTHGRASRPSISVPGTSHLSGALPLLYSSGQADTQRSKTPVAAGNSAKEPNCRCGVAAACLSQRRCMRPPKVSTTRGTSLPLAPSASATYCLRFDSPIG